MMRAKLANNFLKTLENIRYGRISITTPDKQTRRFIGSEAGAEADLTLHDWGVIGHLLSRGDIGFVEDYRAGLWETKDLPALLIFAQQNHEALKKYSHAGLLVWLEHKMRYFFRRNSHGQAKENIRAHYDLGNEFYALWLDKSMTYSSALFHNNNEDLAQGQQNKYGRILARLGQKPGKLLEIGCGWGGFAARAQAQGHEVKAITLSKAQYDYARAHAGDNTNIALEDYRSQKGLYDYIVSIEMIEAVGEKYWPVYFAKVADNLKRNGKAVIQAITIEDNAFRAYRRGTDVIRSFIFPGGMLLSPTKFRHNAAKAGLKITNVYQFGQDYARTLRTWLTRFDEQSEILAAKGYSLSFQRLWRFYLAACIASFTAGNTDVMQIELQHQEV